jgi:hypothetical protein
MLRCSHLCEALARNADARHIWRERAFGRSEPECRGNAKNNSLVCQCIFTSCESKMRLWRSAGPRHVPTAVDNMRGRLGLAKHVKPSQILAETGGYLENAG